MPSNPPVKAKIRGRHIATAVRGGKMFRDAVRRSHGNVFGVFRDFFLRSRIGNRLATAVSGFTGASAQQRRSFSFLLPAGYPAARLELELSTPPLPRGDVFEFSEHSGTTVLVSAKRTVAVSHDLGKTWTSRTLKGFGDHRIVHVKGLANGEVLVQLVPNTPYPAQQRSIALVVIDDAGTILAQNRIEGSPWHSARAIDFANGTLMFAEYPFETHGAPHEDRSVSRVFRSRDHGRSWEIVREQKAIRHFHYLQARPGIAGEWWLSSGDAAAESRIWVSKDDGDSWTDITEGFGATLEIGKASYPRSLFRLTDLAWHGDDIIWGTDDFLSGTRRDVRGARVFRSGPVLDPRIVGLAKWPVRSMVDLGEFFIFQTQGSNHPDASVEDKRPGVFLMPKDPVEGAPNLIHLFDVEGHSTVRTAFTYSRASRIATDGVFFSFRASTDVFPIGHRVLKWTVKFS